LILVSIVKAFIIVLIIAIFARTILSWFPTANTLNPLVALIYQLTEPILQPLRKIVPRMGMFDLTPTIALLVLFLVLTLLGGV
jgi:YggT family protein